MQSKTQCGSLSHHNAGSNSPYPPSVQERNPVEFKCRLATINVLALDRTDSQTEIGRRTGARTTRLDHQLHAAGIHIAGLQETRTAQGQYRAEHYLILSSGGAGQNAERSGCELWLHRTMPLLTTAAHSKVTLADCTCVVAHADPRRLFVRIEHEALCLTAVVYSMHHVWERPQETQQHRSMSSSNGGPRPSPFGTRLSPPT